MINRDLQSQIRQLLARNYTMRELERGMGKYAKQFVKKHRDICEEEGVYVSQLDLAYEKKLNKMKLELLTSIPLSGKTIFQAFRDFLPEEIGVILDELVWVDRLSHQDTEELFEITIYTSEETSYSSGYKSMRHTLKPEFEFFDWSGGSYYSNAKAKFVIYLQADLRKILSSFYDRPKEADFHPIAEPEQTQHTYNGEQDILLELPRMIAYAGQGQIKTTTKGKVQTSTLGKMQRKLKLKEFYPDAEDKALKNMRTSLLSGLIISIKKPSVSVDIIAQLKDLMKDNYRNNYSSLYGIITYIKGTGYVDNYYVNNVEPTIFNMLKDLPKYEWVSMKNIQNHIKYNFINVQLLRGGIVRDKLYYTYKAEGRNYTYDNKVYIEPHRYIGSFINPFLKGTFFLFAAFGLLEIAYDTPNVSEMGKTAQSPYDKLKYIRLTKLGAFILGIEARYEAPDAISKSTITLSENSLTVIIDEADTTAPVVLEPYTERVSPNRFRTDFSFFLKGVGNQKQLNDKIQLFKNSVKVDIPPNWEQFFKELNQKIDPLKQVKNTKIFHIPEDNKELLQLVAKDPVFQKICLKAEGYHIFVSNKNLPKFKQRLQEFGYLMT